MGKGLLLWAMNVIQEIKRINEEELSRGVAGGPGSWHAQYK